MKRTRKLLSLALALVLTFALAAGAFAADYPPSGFADVPSDAWYAPAVDFVKAEGLMKGVGDNRFAPEEGVTRAMVVTVLYRMMDEPDVKGKTCPFSDVPVGEWYFNAVIWAADSGVTTGVDATHFEPSKLITREQMATMLMRMMLAFADEESKAQMESIEKLDPTGSVRMQLLREAFGDAESISDYARTYVLFC